VNPYLNMQEPTKNTVPIKDADTKPIDPKKYTLETIRTQSKGRIQETLKRYWKLQKKTDPFDIANKIFK